MAEYNVVLQLIAPPSVDRDVLEQNMLDVLRIVEVHGKDIALGPVVSVDFADRAIDLGFSAEAATMAQSQNMVAELLQIIEQRSKVHFTETEAKSSVAACPAEAVSA